MLANHLKYPKALEYNSHGYALYHPQQSSSIKLGTAGYFDDEGDWHTVLNLLDPSNLKIPRLDVADDEVQRMPPEAWGTVTGEGVSFSSTGLDGKFSYPGSEASFGIKFEKSKKQQYGAVLVTGPYVKKTYFKNTEGFHKWLENNSASILDKFPDIKKHDLWIVTKTCQTPRCIIGDWNEQQQVSLLLGGGAFSNNGLTMKKDWKRDQTSNMWRFFDKEGGDDWVVFIGGHRYKFSRLLNSVGAQPLRKVDGFRGKDDTFPNFEVEDSEGAKFSVECEVWGEED